MASWVWCATVGLAVAPAAAAPAASWWTLAGLAGALVAAGVVMLRRRERY